MADSSIVNPGNSSYSLPTPTDSKVGEVPQMSLNRVLPRQQSTGQARGIQQFGSQNVYVDSGNNHFIVADTAGTSFLPRVLMGNQINKGDGFYVSKEGIDVTSAQDDNDFIFNSNQNVFKIVDTDTISMDLISATISYLTVQHNLGFAPIPMAFLTDVTDGFVNGNIPFPVDLGLTVDVVSQSVVTSAKLRVAADAVNVYFEFFNATGVDFGSFNIRYYLLQESSGVN